ncbi:oligosaccharide flippase family protein [Leisingera sp. XS_AS12]|uniref:oligosaccharide flippase family protein n=1 Tax=Leisingera sp. XS_AS12 TaxID=3241294 RepID=UPI00351347BF
MARHFLVSTGTLSAARLISAFSQLLILPVISRFLTVQEFGLVALAMAVVLFAQLFSDAGLGRSLIRQPHIDAQEWGAVFWLLFCIGPVLALAALAAAPAWAWLHGAPDLFGLVAALSVTPMFLAWAAVPNARLERDGRFAWLALIRTGAALAGMAAAVALAVSGAGVWALVVQQVLLAALQCAGAFALSGFRPGRLRWGTELHSHLAFARNSLGVSLLQTMQRQVPVALIGQQLGTAPLGLFTMSSRLLNQSVMALAGPMAQVTYVRMAAAQDDRSHIAALYVSSIRLLALAIFPPMAVLAGAGGDLFAFIFSEPWRGAGLLFALAAPGIALETAVGGTAGVMFQAMNQTGLRLRMATERTVLRLAAISIALPFGIEAVSAVITMFALAYLPRYWFYACQVVPFSRLAALRAMAATAAPAALAWVVMHILAQQVDGWSLLGVAAALLAVAWILAAGLQWRSLRAGLAKFGH